MKFLGSYGIEIQIPQLRPRARPGQSFAEDRTASWKSYLISNQDPITQARNHCERERAIAKENEPSASELHQSRIEETHATQELVLADPVCYVKETVLMEEGKWIDIPANKFYKEDASSAEFS